MEQLEAIVRSFERALTMKTAIVVAVVLLGVVLTIDRVVI